jgi:hypothetical protein
MSISPGFSLTRGSIDVPSENASALRDNRSLMDTSFINVSLIVIGAHAVCAAIAWLMTLCSNQGPRHDAENHASTTDSSDHPTTISQRICNWFGIAQRSESLIAQPKPTDEQHRANEEVYWQESLRRQHQSNHITIVAAGVSVAGLVILFGTLLGTCKQAYVMSESFQVDQHRTWWSIKLNRQPRQALEDHLLKRT